MATLGPARTVQGPTETCEGVMVRPIMYVQSIVFALALFRIHAGNNLSGFASHCAIQNSYLCDASLTPGAKRLRCISLRSKTYARTHP